MTTDAISAGAFVTCALTPIGAVKCWGANSVGQLGNNSTTESHVPVGVAGLTSGVVSISTGDAFSCALTATGAVKCWGQNFTGQLGNNSTTDSHIPVGVVGLSSGMIAVSAGSNHACAVNGAGALMCWGSNSGGQLGDNSTTDSHVPVPVTGLSSGVVAVSASAHHTCALTVTGGVKCWGANTSGELGTGSAADSLVPLDVVGLPSAVVRVVASAYNACALTGAGGVKCWGNNFSGQLGDGSVTYSNVPVDVKGLTSDVLGLSAAKAGACAITSTGGVKCWGTNAFGQLGNGTLADSYVPVDVVGLAASVVAIDSGDLHTCAILSTGAIQCWGWNVTGVLGNNSTVDSHVPVNVIGF
jgi:alpha-tubulin suppressor-like RCC1 family protein